MCEVAPFAAHMHSGRDAEKERTIIITTILQGVLLGILSGGVYALMASGLTLVFGVMEIINIAQGVLVILGAYLSYWLEQRFHIDLFLGLFITIPVMFALGVFIEWAFIRRIKWDRITLSILVTFAIAVVIEGVLTFLFTGNLVTLQANYIDKSIMVPFINYYIPLIYVYAFILSVILLGALYLLVYYTSFGRSLRASMQNRTAASLIGINVPQVQAITFGLGTALAAAGGMVYGATNTFNPASSYDLISRLLVIIVLGGMGSLWGALAGSMIMIVVSDVVILTFDPVWSSTVFFAFLVILLVFRPQGLFGRLEGRKQ
jgi:branched-chain amino acid transport system permease protein